ncbi:unnamed protein product [Acanthoscelides obtectus]|uniref:Uncharacterized protein n=1 Tax=Acanthoscelides obtectus TaxID=200917 RepID=A0A9P0KWM4_ACAOB|nr:unnamed protein product [Acanthoscelides obtectus]CAK1628303.1 hypothetical protein AOBTE_LOCUS5122 [Acanthoscelides obtectus]
MVMVQRENGRTPSPTPTLTEPLISPKDICPLPMMKTQNTNRKNSRAAKAAIITSTPYKKSLKKVYRKSKKKKKGYKQMKKISK